MEILEDFNDIFDSMDNGETVYWTQGDMNHYGVLLYWHDDVTQMFGVYFDGENIQNFNANDFERYRNDGIVFCVQMDD